MLKNLRPAIYIGVLILSACKKDNSTTTPVPDAATAKIKAMLEAGNANWKIGTGTSTYYDVNNKVVTNLSQQEKGYWNFSPSNASPGEFGAIRYFEAFDLQQTTSYSTYSLSVQTDGQYISIGDNKPGNSLRKYKFESLSSTSMKIITKDFTYLSPGIDHATYELTLTKYN